MLVDKTEFEAWMERIMGELYRISRKLDKAENRQKHLNYLNGERLYDNQEVCQLLRISKRTLQRYRNNGALKFHSIYHKTYYKESDLHEFIRNNFDENEIKRQARKDKLSETYPMPEEMDENGGEKETEEKELSDDCGSCILDVHRSGILSTAVKQEVPAI